MDPGDAQAYEWIWVPAEVGGKRGRNAEETFLCKNKRAGGVQKRKVDRKFVRQICRSGGSYGCRTSAVRSGGVGDTLGPCGVQGWGTKGVSPVARLAGKTVGAASTVGLPRN